MTFRLLVGKCRITHFIHVYQKQIFKIPCEDHCMQLTTWTDVGGIEYYSTILKELHKLKDYDLFCDND